MTDRIERAEKALANAEMCHHYQPSKWPYDYTAQHVRNCRAELKAAKAEAADNSRPMTRDERMDYLDRHCNLI